MKTRIPAIIAICCLAVVTPAFGKKKKGQGGDNQPTSEQTAPPVANGGTGTNPTTGAGTPPPTGAPPVDAGASAPPTTPLPTPPLLAGNLTTLSGETYVAVALKRVDPDGLLIIHRDGVAKVLIADLPENVRARYYDAKTVAAFQAAQAAQAGRQAKERAAAAERQAKEQAAAEQKQGDEKKKEQAKEAVKIQGKVIQVVKEGIILERDAWEGVTDGRPRPLLGGSDAPIFLRGHSRQDAKVDGDLIDVDAFPDGIFSYTNTLGAAHRLRQYQVIKTYR